jgi:hypothetical protein
VNGLVLEEWPEEGGSFRNHREVIAAFDFFTIPTMTIQVLFCFFVIEHGLVPFKCRHLRLKGSFLLGGSNLDLYYLPRRLSGHPQWISCGSRRTSPL